jgi:hypothetical protein
MALVGPWGFHDSLAIRFEWGKGISEERPVRLTEPKEKTNSGSQRLRRDWNQTGSRSLGSYLDLLLS